MSQPAAPHDAIGALERLYAKNVITLEEGQAAARLIMKDEGFVFPPPKPAPAPAETTAAAEATPPETTSAPASAEPAPDPADGSANGDGTSPP